MVFKYTLWTKEEEQFIIDNFGKLSYHQMGEKLGKTLAQVNSKVQHLGKRGLVKVNKRRKTLPKLENEITGTGLDLTKVKMKLGKNYEVFILKQENEKLDDYFKGIFVQDTSRHITLKNKLGYCQSFLKADILMGIIEIKELN